MSGYIDADAADKLLESFIDSKQNAFTPTAYIAGLQRAKRIISVLPAADVQEVKHARWEKQDDEFVCTACKAKVKPLPPSTIEVFRYCPGCGARMDQEEEQ